MEIILLAVVAFFVYIIWRGIMTLRYTTPAQRLDLKRAKAQMMTDTRGIRPRSARKAQRQAWVQEHLSLRALKEAHARRSASL